MSLAARLVALVGPALIGLSLFGLAAPARSQSQVMPPGDLQLQVVARVARADGSRSEVKVEDGGLLRSGDALQLHMRSERDAYVYVIAYGSTRSAMIIHPFRGAAEDALLRAGEQRIFPGPGHFLPLDDNEGQENIYAITSARPLPELSRLLVRMEARGGDLRAVDETVRREYSTFVRVGFRHVGEQSLVGVSPGAPKRTVTPASAAAPLRVPSFGDVGAATGQAGGGSRAQASVDAPARAPDPYQEEGVLSGSGSRIAAFTGGATEKLPPPIEERTGRAPPAVRADSGVGSGSASAAPSPSPASRDEAGSGRADEEASGGGFGSRLGRLFGFGRSKDKDKAAESGTPEPPPAAAEPQPDPEPARTFALPAGQSGETSVVQVRTLALPDSGATAMAADAPALSVTELPPPGGETTPANLAPAPSIESDPVLASAAAAAAGPVVVEAEPIAGDAVPPPAAAPEEAPGRSLFQRLFTGSAPPPADSGSAAAPGSGQRTDAPPAAEESSAGSAALPPASDVSPAVASLERDGEARPDSATTAVEFAQPRDDPPLDTAAPSQLSSDLGSDPAAAASIPTGEMVEPPEAAATAAVAPAVPEPASVTTDQEAAPAQAAPEAAGGGGLLARLFGFGKKPDESAPESETPVTPAPDTASPTTPQPSAIEASATDAPAPEPPVRTTNADPVAPEVRAESPEPFAAASPPVTSPTPAWERWNSPTVPPPGGSGQDVPAADGDVEAASESNGNDLLSTLFAIDEKPAPAAPDASEPTASGASGEVTGAAAPAAPETPAVITDARLAADAYPIAKSEARLADEPDPTPSVRVADAAPAEQETPKSGGSLLRNLFGFGAKPDAAPAPADDPPVSDVTLAPDAASADTRLAAEPEPLPLPDEPATVTVISTEPDSPPQVEAESAAEPQSGPDTAASEELAAGVVAESTGKKKRGFLSTFFGIGSREVSDAKPEQEPPGPTLAVTDPVAPAEVSLPRISRTQSPPPIEPAPKLARAPPMPVPDPVVEAAAAAENGYEAPKKKGKGLFGAIGSLFSFGAKDKADADKAPADTVDGDAPVPEPIAIAPAPAQPRQASRPAPVATDPQATIVTTDSGTTIDAPLRPSPQPIPAPVAAPAQSSDEVVLGGAGSRIRALLDGDVPEPAPAAPPAAPPVAASPESIAPALAAEASAPPAPVMVAVPSSDDAPITRTAALGEPAPDVAIEPVASAPAVSAQGRPVVEPDQVQSMLAAVTPSGTALPGLSTERAIARAADAAVEPIASVDPSDDDGVAGAVVLVVTPTGNGSGVVLDELGHVLVNWQVVRDFTTVSVVYKTPGDVRPSSERVHLARVLKINRFADLALIEVQSPPEGAPVVRVVTEDVGKGVVVHAVGHGADSGWIHTIGKVSRVKAGSSWYSGNNVAHRGTVVRAKLLDYPAATGAPLFNNSLELVGLSTKERRKRKDPRLSAVSASTIRRFLAGAGGDAAPAGGG